MRMIGRVVSCLVGLFVVAAIALAQTAPVGVCVSNIAETITNGVLVPIPQANVYLCTYGSTASNCVAHAVSVYATNALSGTPIGPPTQADAGGNFYFCARHGHYTLMVSAAQGSYIVPDLDLVDDWANGGVVNGDWTANHFLGNATTASALAAAGTDCNSLTQFAYGIDASGNALCNTLPTPVTVYYQTVSEAGTALTQQPILNFDGTVVATAGTGKTNVGLPATGTAGTYAYPTSVTTDAQGRITGITGSTGVITRNCTGSYPSESCYRVSADGTIEAWGHISVTFSSGTFTSGTLTYPNTGSQAFTANPTLTLSANDAADGDNNFAVWEKSPATTGGTIDVRCAVNIGGSGCTGSLSSTVPIAWYAIGH